MQYNFNIILLLKETKKKQQLANALRSARARLRKLCSTTTNIFSVATSDVDLLCSSLPVEKLQALCNTIQNNPSTAQQAFDAEVHSSSSNSLTI